MKGNTVVRRVVSVLGLREESLVRDLGLRLSEQLGLRLVGVENGVLLVRELWVLWWEGKVRRVLVEML